MVLAALPAIRSSDAHVGDVAEPEVVDDAQGLLGRFDHDWEDIDHAAEAIAEGSSVPLIIWEDLGAQPSRSTPESRRRDHRGARIPAGIAQDLDLAVGEAN